MRKLVIVMVLCMASVSAFCQSPSTQAPTTIELKEHPVLAIRTSDAAVLLPPAAAECHNSRIPAPEAIAAQNVMTHDHSDQFSVAQEENAAHRSGTTARAAHEPGSMDVSATLAKVNQSVFELSEATEAAIGRYPNTFSILPFGGPTFVISPHFPWGEPLPMPRISIPRGTYTSPTEVH